MHGGEIIKEFKEKLRVVFECLEESIFPAHCPCCDKIAEGKYGICDTCLKTLGLVKKPYCMKCGKHIENEDEELCKACMEHPRSYEFGFPLLSYDSVSAPIMYDIKYNNKRDYVKVFAKMIQTKWGKKIKSLDIDCIMPIPVHSYRLRQRGYNQAEVLAKNLSVYLGIRMETKILLRCKNTKAQKELGPKERLENLKEAFVCDKAADVSGMGIKNVLLVDDIYTTGSTIEACTLALKGLGVKKVYYTSICIVEQV